MRLLQGRRFVALSIDGGQPGWGVVDEIERALEAAGPAGVDEGRARLVDGRVLESDPTGEREAAAELLEALDLERARVEDAAEEVAAVAGELRKLAAALLDLATGDEDLTDDELNERLEGFARDATSEAEDLERLAGDLGAK